MGVERRDPEGVVRTPDGVSYEVAVDDPVAARRGAELGILARFDRRIAGDARYGMARQMII
jgi:hypothetical protein